MKLFIKFDFNTVCNVVLKEKLDALDVDYEMLSFGEVVFLENISDEKHQEFIDALAPYGIEIVEDHKSILVQNRYGL